MSEKIMTYEASIVRLENIVKALDQGDISLDESIKLFKEGLSMVEMCQKQLDKAEGEIKILIDGHFVDFEGQA